MLIVPFSVLDSFSDIFAIEGDFKKSEIDYENDSN